MKKLLLTLSFVALLAVSILPLLAEQEPLPPTCTIPEGKSCCVSRYCFANGVISGSVGCVGNSSCSFINYGVKCDNVTSTCQDPG